jgi:hypothetical protein
MLPPNGSFPDDRSANSDAQDHEFEWLLCLASAFEAFAHQSSNAFETSEKPLHLTGAAGSPSVAPPISAWEFALRKIQRWRQAGSNRRDAA